MRNFDEIFEIAADRKGGKVALEGLLQKPVDPDKAEQADDDRWLSTMAKCIFQAGFSWKVIEAKWPGFEKAFEGFDPARVAMYHSEDTDRLLGDNGIVRNFQKISAVLENAVFLRDLASEHGSGAKYFARWPTNDLAGLLEQMKKRGARLGGNTGQRVLRAMGCDAYVLTRDVVARLVAEGVITGPPASKRAMNATQNAFNDWAEQSGRPLTQISRILAFSVGD